MPQHPGKGRYGIPVFRQQSVIIVWQKLKKHFTPLVPCLFYRIYQCLRPAYLSSLKLLWLKPPNTPFRSLPTTQNTKNKMIISPMVLLFYTIINIKIRKNCRQSKYTGLINNLLYSSLAAVLFILFRLFLVTRAAGLTAVELYPVPVEYAPD